MDQFGPHRNLNLAFIAAQKRRSAVHMPNGDPIAFLQKNPTPFPFLLDESREVTKAYGVYVAFNYESINIARPATFVIAPDSTIRFLHIGKTQTDRAPLEEVLAALQQASS